MVCFVLFINIIEREGKQHYSKNLLWFVLGFLYNLFMMKPMQCLQLGKHYSAEAELFKLDKTFRI